MAGSTFRGCLRGGAGRRDGAACGGGRPLAMAGSPRGDGAGGGVRGAVKGARAQHGGAQRAMRGAGAPPRSGAAATGPGERRRAGIRAAAGRSQRLDAWADADPPQTGGWRVAPAAGVRRGWLTAAAKAPWARVAPTLLAGVLAAIYVAASPPSGDLAAHLLRARLFASEGFGLWNNWWYAGHPVVMYSLLFPAVASVLTPQGAAAAAAVGTAALFEPLARRHFGSRAWLGSLWFAAATATSLYTGRLTFAFGMLPAVASALALQRRRGALAAGLAALSALCSPVAALFAALAGVAVAGERMLARRGTAEPVRPRRGPAEAVAGERMLARSGTAEPVRPQRGTAEGVLPQPATGGGALARPGTVKQALPRRGAPDWLPGAGVAVAALAPVGLLALAFPEGGVEPFVFSAFWPLPLIAFGLALAAVRRGERVLAVGAALYGLGTVLSYAIPSAAGSNVGRLEEMVAGPLAALLLWPRRRAWLLAAALPLLYLQWQAPVRTVLGTGGPAVSDAYYRPLLNFLARQGGPPFRVEIPFTEYHWEAYAVAPHFALARGWERQLDIRDNPLFYDGRLTPASYERWLHRRAVRFVAVPDLPLDYSAVAERRLIERGLPYL